MNFAPHLRFLSSTSTLRARADAKVGVRSLEYHCELHRRKKLSEVGDDGRDLSRVPWSLTVFDTPIDEEEFEEKAIGLATYLPPLKTDDFDDDESFAGSVRVSSQIFEVLLGEHFRNAPLEILISVRGLTYGWAPDGSSVKWNIAESKALPIEDLSINFSSPRKAEPDVDEPIAPPVSRPSGQLHSPVDLRIVYWLLAGILVAILLR